MTPAQKAAARTAHTEAVADLAGAVLDTYNVSMVAEMFMRHTEVLAGHLALALDDGPPDTYARLTPDASDGLTPRQVTARARAEDIVSGANDVLAASGTDKRLILTFDPPTDPDTPLQENS